jgi:hypothetical protein
MSFQGDDNDPCPSGLHAILHNKEKDERDVINDQKMPPLLAPGNKK